MTKGEKRGQNYRLESPEVERLLHAKDAPPVSDDELRRFQKKKSGLSLPLSVKALAVKAWFYGMVCYFVIWGLGFYLRDTLDLLFVTGLIQGMVTDLLANGVVRRMKGGEVATEAYILISSKGLKGFVLNLMGGLAVAVLIYTVYGAIHTAIAYAGSSYVFGVEPIAYGLLGMGAEMLLILCKRTLRRIVMDAKREYPKKGS